MFIAYPLLTPFLLLAIPQLRRFSFQEALVYFVFSYGYVLALVAYGALTRGQSPGIEHRYVVPAVIVSLPLVAHMVTQASLSGVRIGILSLITLWNVVASFHVTRQFMEESILANYFATVWRGQFLPETSSVFVHKRQDDRNYYRNDVRAIEVLSNRPLQVLGSRGAITEDFDAAMSAPEAEFEEFLREHDIQVILTDSSVAVPRLAATWQLGGHINGYKVFVTRERARSDWLPPPPVAPSRTMNTQWENGLRLLGLSFCGESGAAFPHFIVPQWEVHGASAQHVHARWIFEPTLRGEESFELTSRVAGALVFPSSEPQISSDRVIVGSYEPREAGEYSGREGRFHLYLTLADASGATIPIVSNGTGDPDRLDLGLINILHSKAHLLHKVIKREPADPRLVLDVVLSLMW